MNTQDLTKLAVPTADTAIQRDLKLNLEKLLGDSSLPADISVLTLLSLARALNLDDLAAAAAETLAANGLSEAELTEARQVPAIMGMLNIYYRAKHMVKGSEWGPAGLRMTSLARPALGKQRFEMLAYAVSVLNGCETCVNAHAKVILEGGGTQDQVHDLTRLAAVLRGIQALR